jgi:predicted neuraminidase
MRVTWARLAVSFMLSTAGGSAAFAPEFIFTAAPFASAHASTIVQLRDGDLLVAWFGGSAEGKPDVAIWCSRRASGRWTAPVELVREPNIACYNPVLFYNKEGRLWFYYKFGPQPSGWSAGRRWSSDDGKTWSAVEHLPAGLYGPIRAKPLLLPDGTIVSGTSVESYRSWACWIERSTDGGVSWTKIGPITLKSPTEGIIQPSVVSLGGKRLVFYARSTAQTGRICFSESADAGLTWSQARPLDLPNPNSGIDAVALRDGRVVLVYNNSTHDRTPLNVALSTDGKQFRIFGTLEAEPGEYSYPAIIQGKDGDLHVTYTWKRQRIRYVRIPLKDVR